MNMDTLRYFLALGDCSSFTEAAQRFYISQQGFNKAITSLESEVGCKLVERGNKGVELTSDGEVMLGAAARILAEYDSALSGLSVRKTDARILSEFDGKMAVSPICMHAIVEPLMEHGLLGDVKLREIDGLEAGRYADEGGWVVLADVPRFAIDSEAFDALYETKPVLRTRVGVLGKKELIPPAPVISAAVASELPLGFFDNATTRLMYETIFSEHPVKRAASYTTSIGALLSNAERGRYAILADSFQWRQYLLGGAAAPDMAFARIEGQFESEFGFVFRKDGDMDDGVGRLMNSLDRAFHDMVAIR